MIGRMEEAMRLPRLWAIGHSGNPTPFSPIAPKMALRQSYPVESPSAPVDDRRAAPQPVWPWSLPSLQAKMDAADTLRITGGGSPI